MAQRRSRRSSLLALGLVLSAAASWSMPSLAGAAERPAVTADQASSATPLSNAAGLATTVNAPAAWRAGFSGRGIDVAVIDSGVVPVNGLKAPGKVVNGPDVSFDSGQAPVRYLDAYGHGTHMAGIISGRDNGTPTPVRQVDVTKFAGIAPDSRIVNVKVADSRGATDVTQVIAALDWVVEHRRDRVGTGSLNIRVISLSFGTNGVQSYQLDPLAYAVERAWHAGVVVVVAAGNEGFGDARLNNPAYDPYVIAVGASDGRGTPTVADDVLAPYSSRGIASRRPDLLAPGSGVSSLRSPGSYLDQTYPAARQADRFFRGSGTSQATAVVAGAAALLLQQRPNLTPDQVKALLVAGGRHLGQGDQVGQGAGLIDINASLRVATPNARQTWPRAQGVGSLDLARGTVRVSVDGVALVGQQSIFFTTWSVLGTVTGLLGGNYWSGGGWAGNSWTGGSWQGNSWTGRNWRGNSWTGNSWTGNSWTGNSWTGNSWTGNSWTSASWSSANS